MSNWIRAAVPLLAVGAMATPLRAQQGFEGVVTLEMHEAGDAGQMTQMYKGSKVRTEVSGRGGMQGVMLMDGGSSQMTMVMPAQRMYMTMDLKRMGEQMGGQHDDATPPRITDTGKSETIAGKSCSVYRYAEEAGKPESMELCAAKGMGYFMMGAGAGPMGGRGGDPMAGMRQVAANPAYAKLYKDGFFPLRVTRLEGGKATTIMLVKSIEPKSLDAALFEIPAGYTEMKMPAGMPQRP